MSLALFEHRCFSQCPLYARNLCFARCSFCRVLAALDLRGKIEVMSAAQVGRRFLLQIPGSSYICNGGSPGARRARTGSPNLNSIKRVSRRLENACTPRMAGACNLFRCAVDRLTIACRPQRSFALSVPRPASIWADGVRPAVENTEWSAMGARRAAIRLLSPASAGRL